jgi:hypothetical protein
VCKPTRGHFNKFCASSVFPRLRFFCPPRAEGRNLYERARGRRLRPRFSCFPLCPSSSSPNLPLTWSVDTHELLQLSTILSLARPFERRVALAEGATRLPTSRLDPSPRRPSCAAVAGSDPHGHGVTSGVVLRGAHLERDGWLEKEGGRLRGRAQVPLLSFWTGVRRTSKRTRSGRDALCVS